MKTKEPSALKAAMHAKCPRCRQGAMFTGPMYSFKTQNMHETCDYCGLRYEREPGYFYVAMFVSYAFTVAEMIIACLLAYFITGEDESPWLYLIVVISTVLLLSPFNYRYSRVVLLFWLTPGLSYQPDFTKEHKGTA